MYRHFSYYLMTTRQLLPLKQNQQKPVHVHCTNNMFYAKNMQIKEYNNKIIIKLSLKPYNYFE